ncbi:MAG: hypothetical protein NTW21_21400 [Verrucomicrobia bacterium]|nr:hypothetical protein [Verrucomicrobiota bacterium]
MSHLRKPATRTPSSDAPTPTVRRISNPRPKKTPGNAAPAPSTEVDSEPPPAPFGTDILAAPSASATQANSSAALAEAPPGAPHAPLSASGDWPEPDAPTTGGNAFPDGKRKRRRRKGKGQSSNAQASFTAPDEIPAPDEPAEPVPAAPAPSEAPKPLHAAPQQAPRQPPPRKQVDPEALARKAWKIFLAEVSEEGVALIGDQDARELARRCFRLAEIFIEEQTRRLSGSA